MTCFIFPVRIVHAHLTDRPGWQKYKRSNYFLTLSQDMIDVDWWYDGRNRAWFSREACGCTNEREVQVCNMALSSRVPQPTVTPISIPNNTLITLGPLGPTWGKERWRRRYLVVAFCIRDAFLAVASVGQRVHDVANVPVLILKFLQDLEGWDREEKLPKACVRNSKHWLEVGVTSGKYRSF